MRKRFFRHGLRIFSKPLAAMPYLSCFLEGVAESEAVLGWGHKPTADKARRYAARHNLPYIALEDGFLRSLDLGCKGAPPLSLVVDHAGIYYDASTPSDLENLLNATGWETPELMDSARRAMERILRHHLSKYNHAPDVPKDFWDGAPSPRVLVLDQTQGDASIGLGKASEATFQEMLDAALASWPRESIRLKMHPDVLSGKKSGHLTEDALARGVGVIAADCSPLSLLERADVVYTVTSQMGFEALMLGKEVYCFGIPFYAGWGLTRDCQTCPRRTRQRSLLEVFAAAYLVYARYVNPIRGEQCDIHETVSLLAEQRRQNERNRGFHACVGFRWWKRPYAKAYLQSTGGDLVFYRKPEAAGRLAQTRRAGGVVFRRDRIPATTL